MSQTGESQSLEPIQHRRGRLGNAVQACIRCRKRKIKCSETKPSCVYCTRLNVECQYKDPSPERQDDTMAFILDKLKRLESRVDIVLPLHAASTSDVPALRPTSYYTENDFASAYQFNHHPEREAVPQTRPPERHSALIHMIILWPSIIALVDEVNSHAAADLRDIRSKGRSWMVTHDLLKHHLPLSYEPVDPKNSFYRPAVQGRCLNSKFPSLSAARIQQYTNAYFETYHTLLPILDEKEFVEDVITRVVRENYPDGDSGTVLALTVFALGQMALEGNSVQQGCRKGCFRSSFCGGSVGLPPGVELFCEGRRQMGFVSTSCTLDNVQILLLQGTYYEANARHMDYWRCISAASSACQVLVQCKTFDWSSTTGEATARSYWACVLSENLFNMEPGLPRTKLYELEGQVLLPYSWSAQDTSDLDLCAAGRSFRVQFHFLAMITLQQLVVRIQDMVHKPSSFNVESPREYHMPPTSVIREMAYQLDSWRALLPSSLQWLDGERLDPAGAPTNTQFTEAIPPHGMDIPTDQDLGFAVVVAQLRTSFYYARFLIYLPFVYKALHDADRLAADDEEGCALAIRSMCLWPLSSTASRDRKYLVPHHLIWTQNFVGILLILRIAQEDNALKRICEERVDGGDLERTTVDSLNWIKDMASIDGVAEWSWRILESLWGEAWLAEAACQSNTTPDATQT